MSPPAGSGGAHDGARAARGGTDQDAPQAPRPRVTLKAAITLDGMLATRSGDSRWITGEQARAEGHRMRARSDAILVGVGTVLADDPQLTVRMARGANPLRVVLDGALRTPLRSKLARGAREVPTLLVHARGADPARAAALQARGVELAAVPTDAAGRLRLRSVLGLLARRGVRELLVEGGARVHGAFLDAGLADRAAVFIAPRILGDAEGISWAAGKARTRMAQALPLRDVRTRKLGPDLLMTGDIGR